LAASRIDDATRINRKPPTLRLSIIRGLWRLLTISNRARRKHEQMAVVEIALERSESESGVSIPEDPGACCGAIYGLGHATTFTLFWGGHDRSAMEGAIAHQPPAANCRCRLSSGLIRQSRLLTGAKVTQRANVPCLQRDMTHA
jgi:hypothetical protein